jgi:PKD domain
LHDIFSIGTYNFHYICLTTQSSPAYDRAVELNTGPVPSTYFDAGDTVLVGGYETLSYYINRMNSVGTRQVPDMDLSVTFTWNPDNSFQIDVLTTNYTYINSAPNKPAIPEGPQTGFLLIDHTYTGSTTDAEDDLVYYRWSWGDGDTSEWLGPYASGAVCEGTHSWDVASTYQIRIQAKDTLDYESSWSNSKWVFFTGYTNMPPDQPPIPIGPSEGTAGLSYMFTGNTTDDETEDIYYQWDWDNGEMSEWLGPYTSGSDCEASYSWSAAGTYGVKVRAKDINDNESSWSDPQPIVISEVTYICGDANNDLEVNVSDAVWIINYVFVGGDPPDPFEAGEANCDSEVNVSDAVWIINWVFVGGNEPCDIDGDFIPDC